MASTGVTTAGGCRAHGAIPTAARTARVRLGDATTAFLTTSAPYRFGLANASGVVATIPDPSSVRGTHRAFAVATDGNGYAIVIDDGLAASLYTYSDCAIHTVRTSTGSPLTVAIGAKSASGDATTGVACNDQNGGILIEAAQARQRSSGRYDVVWSTLNPVGSGQGFTDPSVRFANLAPSDPRVAQARTSRCWAATSIAVTH